MKKVVMVRHGESVWNKENRFTGWTDVKLTERGVQEAVEAGQILKEAGYEFDIAYTSVLSRAIKTLWLIMEEMDRMWIPVVRHWRLNERHYGALQGLNKAETARKYGLEQVQIWRRSFDVRPPALTLEDPRHPSHDPRYASLRPTDLPSTECLKDVIDRAIPYAQGVIAPQIHEGKRVIISAHGNTIRAFIKYMDDISEEEIMGLNIPTGIPLVYELNDDLSPIRRYYLGDPERIAKATEAVANQIRTPNPVS